MCAYPYNASPWLLMDLCLLIQTKDPGCEVGGGYYCFQNGDKDMEFISIKAEISIKLLKRVGDVKTKSMFVLCKLQMLVSLTKYM